jgi:hypothetical protein
MFTHACPYVFVAIFIICIAVAGMPCPKEDAALADFGSLSIAGEAKKA